MSKNKTSLSVRWLYLAVGTASMLFAGIIYAWSILKNPLAAEFSWTGADLALNFTLTMCFFCIGGFLGSKIVRLLGLKLSVILSGLLAGLGFVLTSCLGGQVFLLYLTYALAAGGGIGVAYNLMISTVNAWFPDKRGLASGVMLMGFGFSTLLFGTLLDGMMQNPAIGWRMTFLLFGAAVALVLVIAGCVIRKPDASVVFPTPKKAASAKKEDFAVRDYTTGEMVRRFTFWRAFAGMVCLIAVGNSVISFASDLAIEVGADAALATTLVGVLSVCNGFGRILTGAVFDRFGRRFAMIGANYVTIAAAAITLTAVLLHSLPMGVIGLCLTGISYGSAPTVASAFASAFYGQKHFASNYGVTNFSLMVASFVATACSALRSATGEYVVPFILLLSLSAVALLLNYSIKRP